MKLQNILLENGIVIKVPGSGDGLFALKNFKKGDLIAHFSLFQYKFGPELDEFKLACQNNPNQSDSYRRSCTKYSINLDTFNVKIALPPEFDQGNFPCYGSKVNHHFVEQNAYFDETEHPRWGIIQAVLAKRNIKIGEEILVHYGYSKLPFPFDHPWYWDAYEELKKNESLKP